MGFEEETLLKLHRQYSESEALGLAVSLLRKCKVEIGKLKSERAELEDTLRRRKEKIQNQSAQIYSLLQSKKK